MDENEVTKKFMRRVGDEEEEKVQTLGWLRVGSGNGTAAAAGRQARQARDLELFLGVLAFPVRPPSNGSFGDPTRLNGLFHVLYVL